MTLYSGGGYIAKSRLASSYSRRKKPLRISSNHPAGYNRRVPRRFNEDLDAASQKSVNQKRALSRGIGYRPRESLQQNLQTLNPPEEDKQRFKSKVISQIDKMTEEEIDRISRQIDEITHGENELKAEALQQLDNNQEDEYNQELEDQVDPLVDNYHNTKSVTELSEAGSRARDTVSRGSRRSSKSYIMKLRQELQSEREQRHKLESEIEELKRISSEISSKLGLRP